MEDIHKKFIQAWENGVTEKELCKQFNICKSTAYNWIKLYSPIKRPNIEFCKLGLAFEGDLRAHSRPPAKSVKVIENGDFRGFDSFQAGRIIDFRSGGWRKHDRNLF